MELLEDPPDELLEDDEPVDEDDELDDDPVDDEELLEDDNDEDELVEDEDVDDEELLELLDDGEELLEDDAELLLEDDDELDDDDDELVEGGELLDDPVGEEELDDEVCVWIGVSRLSHAADRNPVATIAAPPDSSSRKRRRASSVCSSRAISSGVRAPMGLILSVRTQARRSRCFRATRLRNTILPVESPRRR